MRLTVFLGLLLAAQLCAQTKETSLGMILSPGDAKLLRLDTETPLDARTGDLLFPGDGIKAGARPASFLFCPSKSAQSISAQGEVRFDAKQARAKSGQLSVDRQVESCLLPQVVRVAVASQQHYGVTMTRGDSDATPVAADALPADVKSELAPLEQALAANPNDVTALVASATLFETRNLPSNALERYQRLRAQMPDAPWVQSKIFELQQAVTAAKEATLAAAPRGDTYALLVGVSKYKNAALSLQFAERDASTFGDLLKSPRGGGLPANNVLLLTDEQATTAAVRNGFQDFLKRRAKKGDTVIIMIAGHGTVESPGSKSAFILTYDSDPQDLNSTALPMGELQSLFDEQLARVGRVVLLVDVCKSGTIGTIKNTSINSEVQQLGEAEGDLLGLMASRPRELSYEGPQFGGGHGAFSYFVLRGLGGDADTNKDGSVDASELIDYVSDQVPGATENKQHPREFGTYDNSMSLSDVTRPGISQTPVIRDIRTGEPLLLAAAFQEPLGTPQAAQRVEEFEAALSAGRILPDDPQNAFQALTNLKPILTPDRYLEFENRLRVALENRAQEVLLDYLTGDQIPQMQSSFERGGRYMEAALQLTPESVYLRGREAFFEGRSMLFDRNYVGAQQRLESSVRIDPNAGYAFNALGIAYLEQAQYDKAVPAFRDAIRRAQHWSYPLHNLALTYVQQGNYQGAIQAYRDAMRLAPQYGYLPYNLGFIYQRIGRRKEAEVAYLKAIELTPDSPEPLNALGSLKASQNKFADAERYYRSALQKDPMYLAARQNLAVLLASRPDRLAEAIQLWQQNLAQSPDHISSRLSLAKALEGSAQNDAAVEQYRAILRIRPDYGAARLALARVLSRTDRASDALAELNEALTRSPGDSQIYILMGEVEAARGQTQAARTAYESALQFAPDPATKKDVQKRLKQLR